MGEPRCGFHRYAFGYSDKKPWGWVIFFVVLAVIDTIWAALL